MNRNAKGRDHRTNEFQSDEMYGINTANIGHSCTIRINNGNRITDDRKKYDSLPIVCDSEIGDKVQFLPRTPSIKLMNPTTNKDIDIFLNRENSESS